MPDMLEPDRKYHATRKAGPPHSVNKAAMLAALLELDRLGLLDGLTYQDIADLLGLGHRATALRYMYDLREVKVMLPGLIKDLILAIADKETK